MNAWPPRRRPSAWHRMRVLGAHLLVGLRDQRAYVGEVAVGGVILVIFLFILGTLWEATFRTQGVTILGGLTAPQMQWYVTFTEAMVMSRVNVARRIDEDVRTGELAYAMLRPGGYLTARLGAYLAERLVRFAFTLFLGAAVALALAGPVPLSAAAAAGALAVAALAFVLEYLIVAGIGIGAFWIEDTSGVYFAYTRVAMVLGGLLIPVDLFPDGIASVARILPFAAMIHAPARLALAPDASDLPEALLHVGASLVVTGCAVAMTYRAALARLSVQGG